VLRAREDMVEPDPNEPDEDPNFWRLEVADLHDGSVAGELIAAVKAVTKKWYRQRKAEERDYSARARRELGDPVLRIKCHRFAHNSYAGVGI